MRTTYAATVEVATKEHRDVDGLTSALVDYHPRFGVSADGWHQVRLTVSATNLTQACLTAIAVATAATGAAAIACEVIVSDVSEERQGSDVVRQTRGTVASVRPGVS